MKKIYIEPMMKIVTIHCEGVIASSLSGEGVNMKINSGTIEGSADSRGGSFWDDEE